MTLVDLRDLVLFEAKIPVDKEINGWLDQTIIQTARQLTALVKYPELFISDYSIALTAAQTSFSLPANVQHIDRDSFRYAVGGSVADQLALGYARNFSMLNDGRARYIKRAGNTIYPYPYGQIVVGDTILFNYWKYPLSALTVAYIADDLLIEPEVIIPELQMRVIARALTFVDQKQVPLYRSLAAEHRSAGIAQTDLDGVGE